VTGAAFEFSPAGMVPLGEGQRVWNEMHGGGQSAEPAPSAVPVTEPIAAPSARPALANVQPRFEKHAAAATPRNVVKMARERAKEIRAELRRLKSLQRELAELERLIAAAKDKSPRATVRALETARRTG